MRVLIADDHPFVVEGVQAFLTRQGHEVAAVVADGNAALRAIGSTSLDVAILDLKMPERDGIEVLRWLRTRGNPLPVVLIAGTFDDHRLHEALQLGVEGVLLKTAAQKHLAECLAAIANGGRWIEPALVQRAFDVAFSGARDDPLAPLTPRERSIATQVAQGQRNRDIGKALGMSEGTVKVHLHRIFQKLGLTSRTELAVLGAELTKKP